MGEFVERLGKSNNSAKRWHYVTYDQLHSMLLPEHKSPSELGLVFIETTWKANQIPYHKQKLALLLSNQRNFALEMKKKGHPIHYEFGSQSYEHILKSMSMKFQGLSVCEPAERMLRIQLEKLEKIGAIKILPHKGWLTSNDDFVNSVGEQPPWRMDKFYRYIRKSKNILMDQNNKPEGGEWSYDDLNRQPWDGAVELPQLPTFDANPITHEVVEMIQRKFSHHPGQLQIENIPSTYEQTQELWNWAKSNVMYWFGPYEDAMTTEHKTLFHTTISSLLNLHRLLPSEAVNDALTLDIPLNSKEGFVRQIIGWREFVHHVHRHTDGFNANVPEEKHHIRAGAGWKGEWAKPRSTLNVLEAHFPLPDVYWGKKSGMMCLDSAVEQVVETGYTHHIPRLMVLANLGTLLGVNPRELTDWFWAMFTDAYDWVVEPNVLAMGTYAVGEIMTTKPYVCGTPYIKKMGDYCSSCALHHKKSCPISDMYWNFLHENNTQFVKNHRMSMPIRMLAKREQSKIQSYGAVTNYVRDQLHNGRQLDPKHLEMLKSG